MHTIKHALTNVIRSFKHIHLSLPVSIIISSIIISGGLVGYGLVTGGGTKAPVTMFAGNKITDKDYVLGKKNSDVIVIEYSDPECPFCVQLSPTMKQLQQTYADKVAFVYRHFPLSQIHPHAFDEARAISCAGKIGGEKAYFNYLDTLFSYKYDNRTTQLKPTGKTDIALQIGLDKTSFEKCMDSQETAFIVNADQADGTTAGVQGTPTVFVLAKTRKGYETVALIDGARPAQVFTAAIDEALSR